MTFSKAKFTDIPLLSIGTTLQLAGTVYSGADETLLVLFPDESDAVDQPIRVVEMTQADWVKFLQQTDHLEVEQIAPDQDGKLVKAIVRKSQRQIDQGTSWGVWKRDGFRCRYCGVEGGFQGTALTVDHLVTWEEGGPSIPANLVTACRRCNKTRGNLPYSQWLRHPHYLKVSQGLIGHALEQNRAVADTLHAIPRVKVKSR